MNSFTASVLRIFAWSDRVKGWERVVDNIIIFVSQLTKQYPVLSCPPPSQASR